MKISKEFKEKMVEQFEEWLDENVKKGDILRNESTDIVIVFQIIKD